MRRKTTKPKKASKQTTCPNCGYCEHCGRANAAPVYAPWPAPYYPYPWYVYPTTTVAPLVFAGSTISVTNTDIPITGSTVNVPSVWTNLDSAAPANWSFTAGGTN